MKILNHLRILLPVILALSLVFACKNNQPYQEVFQRAEIQRIIQATDHRESKVLYQELEKTQDDTTRAIILNGLISAEDSTLNPTLLQLMNHPSYRVRSKAWLALGSNGNDSVPALLIEQIKNNPSTTCAETWKALGRTCSLKDYSLCTELAIEAPHTQAPFWFFYFTGLEGIVSNEAISAACKQEASEVVEQRLAAAHFLARSQDLSLDEYLSQLIEWYKNEKSADVRIALALAMKNCSEIPHDSTMELLLSEEDERCQMSLMRSFWKRGIIENQDILPFLNSEYHPVVLLEYAKWLADQSWSDKEYEGVKLYYDQLDDPFVQAALLKGLIIFKQESNRWIDQAKGQIQQNESPYVKAAFLNSLEGAEEISYLMDFMDTSQPAPVSTMAAQTLIAIEESGKWTSNIEFMDVMELGFKTEDPTIISLFCYHIVQLPEGDARKFAHPEWLSDALSSLTLPEETETQKDLLRAIAWIEGNDVKETDPVYNHPPTFEHLTGIEPIEAIIETSKGSITLDLYPGEAPLTVNDFIAKAKNDYYNGKYFHRVVPAFVIQGGCKRGDGWGSEDYTLRSEFSSLCYREGTIGKASVGKDTEGVQWFITHNSTPHLEWNYTNFGQVTAGMEVVRSMEVGDKIIGITLGN